MDTLFHIILEDKFVFYPFAALTFYFLCLEAAKKTKLVFQR